MVDNLLSSDQQLDHSKISNFDGPRIISQNIPIIKLISKRKKEKKKEMLLPLTSKAIKETLLCVSNANMNMSSTKTSKRRKDT